MIYHNYVYRKTKTLYEHFHAQLIHILTIENYSALYAIPIETPVVLQAHAEEIIEGAPLRICAERADIIICTSHYGASLFAALAPNSVRKIRVLHPAVDCEGYSVPTRASRHTSIVTVARLDSRKNIDTLIRAFGLLMHETPDATLTIIGDGPERNMLEALARKTAPGKILFTGWATEARKRELLGKARVFVTPAQKASA